MDIVVEITKDESIMEGIQQSLTVASRTTGTQVFLKRGNSKVSVTEESGILTTKDMGAAEFIQHIKNKLNEKGETDDTS